MGGFENFVQISRQKEQQKQTQEETKILQQSLYNVQKDAGLGSNVEGGDVSADYVSEQLQERIEQSTFEERTQYYFENSEYMEAKAERYRALANDEDNELQLFSEKYTNRDAKKRQKKATEAANAFEKAKNLEEKYNQDGDDISPLEQYNHRNEIMRARMDGMIAAARVKATSKENEQYRIAKAKLSCLTILMDQAVNLQDTKNQKSFLKIQKNLAKEIVDANKTLKQYADTTSKWKEALGLNDPELLEKKRAESQGNPVITQESVEVSGMLVQLSDEYKRPEYKEAAGKQKAIYGVESGARCDEALSMTYSIKRDKNGNPINKEELKKEKWNKKWLAAYSDKNKAAERKQLITESLKRVRNYEFPPLEDIKKKGLIYYIKRDTRLFDIMQQSLRIDNLRRVEPYVSDYLNHDPIVKAKMDHATSLGQIFSAEISLLGLQTSGAHAYQPRVGERTEEEQKEDKEYYQSQLEGTGYTMTEASEQKLKEAKEASAVPASYEEAKKEALEVNGNKSFNETSYELYTKLFEVHKTMKCPEYLAIHAPIVKKYGSHKDMSRLCGSMLHIVHFDKDWNPISKEDKEAHAWNLKYLNNLTKYLERAVRDGDKIAEPEYTSEEEAKEYKEVEETLRQMVDQETKKYFLGQFDLPTPEQMKKDIIEPMKNGEPVHSERFEKMLSDPEDAFYFMEKTLSLEGTYLNLPFMKDYMKENPAINAFSDLCTLVSNQILPAYSFTKTGVAMNPAVDIQFLSKMGMTMDQSTAGYFEMLMADYEQRYQGYLDALKKQYGGA